MKTRRYFAAVGNDGRRPVVWGLGATEDEALAEAASELADAEDDHQKLQVHEITADQDDVVRAGEIVWPIEARCQCGLATGVPCSGDREVTIEWMPPDLRGEHRAAGNYGVYPHNGAERLRVSRECAAMLCKTNDDSDCHLVEDAS